MFVASYISEDEVIVPAMSRCCVTRSISLMLGAIVDVFFKKKKTKEHLQANTLQQGRNERNCEKKKKN